jgi:hypothetical protein
LFGSHATIANTIFLGGNNRIDYNNDDIRFIDTGINVVGGHITASNNISAVGYVSASQLTLAGGPSIAVASNTLQFDPGGYATAGYTYGRQNQIRNHSFGGHISASGTAYSLFNTSPQAHFGNSAPIPSNYQLQVTGDTFLNGNLYTNSNITASGNISASGDLTISNINGTINGGNF